MTNDDVGDTPPPDDAVDGWPADDDIRDYYELLGVSPDVTREDIERAYRDTAKRQHPDASDLSEVDAEARFRQIVTAREILTNPELRRDYDELGHEEYCRQTDSTGGVTTSPAVARDDENSRRPEPRPGPGSEPSQSGSHRQTSARGAAQKRGDTTVASAGEAFAGAPYGQEDRDEIGPTSSETTDGTHRGMTGDIYDVGVGDGSVTGRSLHVISTLWVQAWHLRVAVGVALVVLLVGLDGMLDPLVDALGRGGPVPNPTTAQVYGVTLLGVVTASVYSCLRVERAVPAGAFLADRDLGRFSRTASRRAQHRGVVALLGMLLLSAVLAVDGTNAWRHASAAIVGNTTAFPWFDIAATRVAGWSSILDLVLTSAFLIAAVLGTIALGIGASIELWRARYELGLRVRPSVVEGVLAGALLTVPVSFVAPSTQLFALPEPLIVEQGMPARMFGIQDGLLTIQTLAVAAIVTVLLLTAGLRLWVAHPTNGDD